MHNCSTVLFNSFLVGCVPSFLIKIMRSETSKFKTNATSWVVKRCTTDFYEVIHQVIILTITQYHLENKPSQLHIRKRIKYRTKTRTGFSRGWLSELTRDHNLMIKLKIPSICYTAQYPSSECASQNTQLSQTEPVLPYSILRNETYLLGYNCT